MSCTNPLRAFDTGYFTENGKPLYKITNCHENYIKKPISQDVALSQKPQDVFQDFFIRDYIEIPCGKCEHCRLTYSKEWMQRCMLEEKAWQHNEMLTLTYDEQHVPKAQGIDLRTGEVLEVNTLCKKDVQDFLKRLRFHWSKKYGEDNIRFYMCGEYGEKFGRPHYHLLMFNFNVRDKKEYKKSQKGFQMYHSQIIEDIWGKGHIELNAITPETCAYVARYVLKKQKGGDAKDYYKSQGKVPEYTNCSRRPGIGFDYYNQNKDKIYEYDKIFLLNNKGLQKLKPAKYYDRLFDAEDTDTMTKIKEGRKRLAKRRQETIDALSGLTKEQQMEYKANAIKDRLKYLQRGYESSGL